MSWPISVRKPSCPIGASMVCTATSPGRAAASARVWAGKYNRSESTAASRNSAVAVDSDRLYFPSQSRALAAALPGEVAVHTIEAPIGHDGFLTEIGQLNSQLRQYFFG